MPPHARRVLWLLPLAFIVHDGEEVLTMPDWIAGHRALLARLAGLGGLPARVVANPAITTAEVAVAVGFELVLFLVATALVVRRPQARFARWLYAALLGAFALHALTHVAQAAYVGGYTPGVVTAVAVIPPAAVLLYRRLFAAGLLTWRSAALSAGVGVLLILPTVLAAHFVGRALAGG